MLRFGNLVLVFGLALLAVGSLQEEVSAKTGKPKKIKIITVTKDGTKVRAKIRVRIYPEAEKDAFVFSSGNGFSEIILDKCDEFVSVTASSTVVGITRRLGDDDAEWLTCDEPKMTFDDFQITPIAVSSFNPEFTNEQFWRDTLGAAALTENPSAATTLADAFANKQYGRISIVASELQYSAREVGKTEEANFFYSLAVDAGVRGVLAETGNTDFDTEQGVLRYSTETNRFELSPELQKVVGKYQVEQLGVSPHSSNVGKFTWQTMTSLPGGNDFYPAGFQFDKSAVGEFSVQGIQSLTDGAL